MSLTRVDLVNAMRDGSSAATAGKPPTDCPFSIASTDKAERMKTAAWLRGYSRAGGYQPEPH